MTKINFSGFHPEWHDLINNALSVMDKDYLKQLTQESHWLPGISQLFAAFSLPLSQTQYILFGESPYPRAVSANGYAFWDQSVESLWSAQGLSKPVNRATSLRNWIKMLLVARGSLSTDTSQPAIAALDKSTLVQTATDFFSGMMKKGILLLNASLVYSEGKVPYHARHWMPFMQELLKQLATTRADIELILFGRIAKTLVPNKLPIALSAEHPFNLSFISNSEVIQFFQPLDLLSNE
ncbi:MAG TPA: uracil-DNA glycosylase [Legionella sp.]|nr:uracil-DNA glycosylase [Legionella sp.]